MLQRTLSAHRMVGGYQMIWGCFVGNKLGPIVFIKGTVNMDAYIETLSATLLPCIDALAEDGMTRIVFQQDNAPAHTAKKTREFFESSGAMQGQRGTFSSMESMSTRPKNSIDV